MKGFTDFVLDRAGNAQENAEVTAWEPDGTATVAVTMYSENSDDPMFEIPFVITDAEGKFIFYSKNQKIDILAEKAGVQQLVRDVIMFDPEDVVEFASTLIELADDKDYPLILNLPGEAEIISMTTDCTAGTATATGKINGTALGGTANAVSTTEQTQLHTTNNIWVPGDRLVVTISSNADAENVTVSIAYKRRLLVP